MTSYSRMIKACSWQQKSGHLFGWAFIALLFTGNSIFGVMNKVEAANTLSQTEANCTIGMAEGDSKAECRVPIPSGCTVAQFPGYSEPWADISKGGGTSCHFDQQHTDWKTSIVGSCQGCTTEQCTGRFIVMFTCANNVPPANPAPAGKK